MGPWVFIHVDGLTTAVVVDADYPFRAPTVVER